MPENHLLRDIEQAIDFSFIYELVEDKYFKDQGRPSLDPVMLIKIPLIWMPATKRRLLPVNSDE